MDGDAFGDNAEPQPAPMGVSQLNTERIRRALYAGHPELFGSLMPYFQLSQPAAENVVDFIVDRTNISDSEKIHRMFSNDVADDDVFAM
ncbi:uncharacterized protein DMAD_07043 [Drosophila madeirensis]|uniref:Uncharacterized protein n=1 Tax=Drosophila madeirensis TaxID=30013 RepID=A0AAU9FTD0_DROMD